MSVKRAFFSVFQKLVVFCCAMFFGFANAFSANLPSGYTELEYIESTGTQYIDTGIKTSSNHGLHIQFARTSPSGDPIVIGTKDTNRWGLNPATNVNIQFGDTYISSGIKTQTNFVYDAKVNYLNDGKWYINELASGTLPPATFTNTHNAYLCAGSWGSQSASLFFSGKIYYSIITENNSIVQYLVPAKRLSDSVIGMYDTVSGTFFTNAGTGEFIAGPVVPETPIKIATTAYNTARFNPVVTDLNSAVATIREIVTNTINQTAAIASLQADKQTRPEDACPAGKKCLLVETEENGVVVPHWFPIIEAPE